MAIAQLVSHPLYTFQSFFSNASGPNAIWIVLNILYYYWKFKMATKFNYAFGLVDLLNILTEITILAEL